MLRIPRITPRSPSSLFILPVFVSEARCASIVTSLSDKCAKLFKRHFEFSQREWPPNYEVLLPALGFVANHFSLFGAYGQDTCRYHHHLWAEITLLKGIFR